MEEIKENMETQESQAMQEENGMPKVESTFEELGVSGEILRAIQEMGYVSPMPVQEKVIPYQNWLRSTWRCCRCCGLGGNRRNNRYNNQGLNNCS